MKSSRVVQLAGATLAVVMVIFYVLTTQSHLLWAVPTFGLVVAAVLVLVGFGMQRREEHQRR